MNVYVTKSKKLTLYVKVNGIKKVIVFNRGIREEKLMAIMLTNQDEIEAIEALSEFNKEFWFYESRPDVQPKVVSRSNKKIYYKEGQDPSQKKDVTELNGNTDTPESTHPTDYPEVTNGQKAKLLLLSLVEGSVHADFNTSEKARTKAKELNITFSNWPVQ